MQGNLPKALHGFELVTIGAIRLIEGMIQCEWPDEIRWREQHRRVVVKVKVAYVLEMVILIDLQVWHTKAFDMRSMNVRVLVDVQALLFDLALPVFVGPLTPVVLLVAVRQRASSTEGEGDRRTASKWHSLVARRGHGDFILIVEETLSETILGVVVVDEECRGYRTSIGISMCRIENRSNRIECLSIEIAHESQQNLEVTARLACQRHEAQQCVYQLR